MPQNIAVPESAAAELTALRQRATLEKLARDWNIQPRNQAEMAQLLDIAAHVRAAKIEEGVKTAADNGNPFLTDILDGLKTERRAEGFATGPTSEEAIFKDAAAQIVAADPVLQAASIQWAEYLANLEHATA